MEPSDGCKTWSAFKILLRTRKLCPCHDDDEDFRQTTGDYEHDHDQDYEMDRWLSPRSGLIIAGTWLIIDRHVSIRSAEGLSMARATRVLIGEDEALVAMDLEMTLTELGYVVVGIGSSGEEVTQLNQQHRPDLILMDVRLQGPVDGFQAATIIQKESNVPILFVSAGLQTQKRTASKQNFLSKPYSNEKLQEAITDLLKNRVRGRE